MSVTGEILRSYVRPRRVMRALVNGNRATDRPEARGFIYLLAGLVIIFVAQIPDLVGSGVSPVDMPDRLVGADGQAPQEARLAITLFAWLFLWPLILYLVGGLSHGLARIFGGRGRGADARLALFWSVLAISPLFLLRGLASVSQSTAAVSGVNALITIAFFWIWLSTLFEAERPSDRDGA